MQNKPFDSFENYISENYDLYEKDIARRLKDITGGEVPQDSAELAGAVSYSTCMSVLHLYHEWLESK